MKLFQSLFMLLICMVSFTALATTPMMEEKQTTTYETAQAVNYVVNVEAVDYVFCKQETAQKAEFILNLSRFKTPKTPKAIITDVGWQSTNKINTKENYLINQNYDYLIRSDIKAKEKPLYLLFA